ncbi:YibE/F family protein [Williamsia sp. CHRR-6]|uniref:YibE/F family protein n=1 Tax=Williamsia sp. CHRR-6 TaxID=2835871 RepID=UPI001BDA15AC|nr:YibE/F family protein [Williamsia sp. CHRR-6]MBT0567439.1 YibE/F family protein [Williamsia sp. CHRR-6]
MSDPHHHHIHSPSEIAVELRPFASRIVVGLIAACAIAVAISAVVLWPSHRQHEVPVQFQSAAPGGRIDFVTGEVVAQSRAACLNKQAGMVLAEAAAVAPTADGPCIDSTVRITSGKDKDAYTLLEVATNRAQSGTAPGQVRQELSRSQLDKPQPGQPDLQIGDKVRLIASPGADGSSTSYTFYDFSRGRSTIVWAVLFVLAVVLVAAWRGLRSVIGLVLAFVVLLYFALPAILDGESPVAVALTASAAILLVVIYLAHGVSLRTSAALLGTLTSLAAAAVLSYLAVATMKLTGLSGEQTTNLQVYQNGISTDGILLAGFIIGALGVLNDVTITQASAVFELASGGRSRRESFTAAMRVGRDHIASTVYTLVFAYAGSALPLLLLFSVAGQSFSDLATTDTVAVELARAFVGGIAIAASVPLTTGIAVLLVHRHERPDNLRAPLDPTKIGVAGRHARRAE